ncbi:MAG: hypothetical protein VYB44_07135 [Bacteroidota bacterium]|nr:hypothetical protein [Bacteroidota bacterium]
MENVIIIYRNESGEIVSVSLKEIIKNIGVDYGVPENVSGLVEGEVLSIEVDNNEKSNLYSRIKNLEWFMVGMQTGKELLNKSGSADRFALEMHDKEKELNGLKLEYHNLYLVEE